MPDTELRFGLIGFGLFGTHHAAAIKNTAGARLVSIAVPSESGQQRARQAHPGVEVVADYHALVERDDIDAVSVVTPNHLHCEVARAALAAGKHVLLEKPMALEVAHCDELNALAREKKLTLAVGHEMRLSPLWGRMRRLIDEGIIGTPQYVMIELSRFPYRHGSSGWRYDLDRVGSWILEEPIHFFDLAHWYLSGNGQPESVYARASARRADAPHLKDNFTAIVNYSGGGYAVISQTLAAFGHHVACKITGSKGSAWAWWSAADARSDQATFRLRYCSRTDGMEDVEVELPQMTGELTELYGEVAAFVAAVRGGTPPPCSGEDGRWSTLLCLAAEAAVQRGDVVDVERFAAG